VDGDTVTVLAAVSATVQNADAPTGEQRQYRMKMQLQHDGDRWLVSDLEFVA
jgi:Mce-associated membrane protein